MLHSGAAGFGGIFRNKRGVWIHGFAGSIGVGDNLLVELMVMYHGQHTAWSKNFHDLTC